MRLTIAVTFLLFAISSCTLSRLADNTVSIPVADAWAGNSINTVIFRHNSITTFKNIQYTAFYDTSGHVIVAQRQLPSKDWQIKKTRFTGAIRDAHKTISIITDGEGYLHMAWNEHNNRLHYVRSTAPGTLTFTDELSMTGAAEDYVTYPEFYRMPNGNLLFLYREGGSGNGNLVMNYYNTNNKKWTLLHNNLIDGEGKRNAYWQCCVDAAGNIHLSWVWRETPDVASNHDICYAVSKDNGKSWQRTDGTTYQLPINAENAEYAMHLPQHSDLVNQTSMTTDKAGHPYIATYWTKKGDNTPQYFLVYYNGHQWKTSQVSHRTTAFSLAGKGTKHIPLSRPKIIVKGKKIFMIFRDDERGDKVSIASTKNLAKDNWKITDITTADSTVGMWEPTYDIDRWKKGGVLDIFVEKVIQKDAEGSADVPPQKVYILEDKL